MTLGPEQRAEAPERRERAGLVRRDLLAVVRADLASAADPDRAVSQQRYMKSALPFYGLTSPRRRAVLRPLWGDPAYRIETEQEWEATVRAMWDGATHREEQYAAVALARHRPYRSWRDAGSLDLCRHLVVTGAWWDLVDEIGVHLVGPVLRADRATVSPVLHRWAEDADLLAAAILANVAGSRFGDQFFIRKPSGGRCATTPRLTRLGSATSSTSMVHARLRNQPTHRP